MQQQSAEGTGVQNLASGPSSWPKMDSFFRVTLRIVATALALLEGTVEQSARLVWSGVRK